MKEYRLYAGAYTDGRPGNGVFFLRNAQTGALESPAGVLALPQAACVKWADRRKKHRNSAEAPRPIEKPRLDPAQQT